MTSPDSGLSLMISDDGNVDHVLKMQGYITGKFVAARDATNGHIQCYVSSRGTSAHCMIIRQLLLNIYGNDAVPFPYDANRELAAGVRQHIVGGGSIQFPSDWQDETAKVRWGSITMRTESLREFPEDIGEQTGIIRAIEEWITEKIRTAGIEIDADDGIR